MKIYEWILDNLIMVFLPQEILDSVVFYVKNPNVGGISHAVTIYDCIGALYACVVGFCAVYFLAWVPFRGILHILRWKRWRGY